MMAEITLIKAITCKQVITEAERNLKAKVPKAMNRFRLLIQRTQEIVPDPDPNHFKAYQGKADAKDLPIHVSADQRQCRYLAKFKWRHFQPGIPSIAVLQPGEFIQKIRHQLTDL